MQDDGKATITNRQNKVSIEILKQDMDCNPLPGAAFTLTQVNEDGHVGNID